jgi:hypothetical protein
MDLEFAPPIVDKSMEEIKSLQLADTYLHTYGPSKKRVKSFLNRTKIHIFATN